MVESENITFHYFAGLNARAGIARALLSYGKIAYTAKNYTFDEWASVKPSMEFGQLPVMEINDVQYSQSNAIFVYLARRLNLLGNSAEDLHSILSLLGSNDDLIPKALPFLFPRTDDQKANIEVNMKSFLEFAVPHLKAYESRASKNGGKFMVGDGFSLADIFVSVMHRQIFAHPLREQAFLQTFIDTCPTVYAIALAVEQNELKDFFNGGGWVAEAPF